MKGLYIHDIDIETQKEYRGVYNKISYQIKAFENNGVDMDKIEVINNQIYINRRNTKINVDSSGLGRLKNNKFFFKIIKKNLIKKDYDFIYIRFSMANIGMLKLIDKMAKCNKKVYLEIPTYPYYEELENNFKNKILKYLDKIIWYKLKGSIYKIVSTSDLKKINNVDVINIINGVDLDKIKLKNKKEHDGINLVGVANVSKWHGYDRVILGLSDYVKSNKTDVNFYIIGGGSEIENLKDLTKRLGVENYVHFLGVKYGKELDRLMEEMDIGVSSLALFRAGGGHDPIKSKEYAAMGIPILLGYKDRGFNEELDFIFQVPSDESYIDIENVKFNYKKLKSNSLIIRKFAEENLSWDSQTKKVMLDITN